MLSIHRSIVAALAGGAVFLSCAAAHARGAALPQQSPQFTGAKVNGGTVACSHAGTGLMLTLSSDFKVPDAPAPHWQVVDSRGNVYLLNRLVTKGDKFQRSVAVPAYVPDVAKVQIWCAWAETLLGETTLQCRSAAGATHGSGATHVSTRFSGAKANQGFVTHAYQNGKSVLILSDDFVVPDTPAPHWQLVDSRGNVYLLNRLVVKNDKLNRTLEVPGFVKDVAKVQIWCAWAETLLGEASFTEVVS